MNNTNLPKSESKKSATKTHQKAKTKKKGAYKRKKNNCQVSEAANTVKSKKAFKKTNDEVVLIGRENLEELGKPFCGLLNYETWYFKQPK